MDEIVALASGDDKNLIAHVDKLKPKEICSYLTKSINNRHENCVELLVALFRGLPCTAEKRVDKRKSVYSTALDILQKGDLSNRLAVDIFGVLLTETSSFPVETLQELSTSFIDSIKSGKHTPGRWLELYPQIVSSIATHDKILYQGEHISGDEYKTQAIDELCSASWPKSYMTHVIIMLKDIVLSNEELDFVVDKLLRMLPQLDYDSVPAVIYQMLLFTVKGHKRQLLKGLIAFFAKQQEKVKNTSRSREQEISDIEEVLEFREEDLYQCEGTCIVHCLFAIKYDQDLGKEFVKLITANRYIPEEMFSPFPLALALAVASIDSLKQPIFDCLKTALARHYKEAALRKGCHWMRKMARDNQTISTEDGIAFVITRSVGGWDSVLEGLVDFAFMLLDSFGTKAFGPGTAYLEAVCAQATDMILKVFKGCRTSRQSIVKNLFARIKPASSPACFIELLAKTVRLIPHAYLESGGTSLLHGVLDSTLVSYPVATACDILTAVRPLLDLNPALQDAVVLTLRKAMFSKQADGRKIAICGLLTFLNKARVLGSIPNSQNASQSYSSQVHVSMHVPIDTATNEGLCLELLGMLQRSLSQQAEVRVIFYKGLPNVVAKNPELTSGALDLLLRQVHHFVEPGRTPPVQLESCIKLQGNQVVQLEPLPCLLKCISQCLLLAKTKHNKDANQDEEEEAEEEWTDPMLVLLKDLTAALSKSELEDFGLDKTAEFGAQTVVGAKNTMLGTLLMGTYEAMMEFAYLFDGYSPATADQMALLYDNSRKLGAVLKEKSAAKKNAGKGKKKKDDDETADPAKGDAIATKNPATEFKNIFSNAFILKILKDLSQDEDEDHQEALTMLRDVNGLEQHLVTVAIERVNEVHEVMSGRTGADAEEDFRFCCSVGLLLFRRYCAVAAGPQPTKASVVAMKLRCLEGFVASLAAITSDHHAKRLPDFLHALVTPSADQTFATKSSQSSRNSCDTTLTDVLGKIKHMVTACIGHEESSKFKELGLLIRAVTLLADMVEPDTATHERATQWMYSLATNNELNDSAVAKSVVTLLSVLTAQTTKYMILLHRLSADVHITLLDVDENVEYDEDKEFAMVTAANSPATILVVIQNVDAVLTNIGWILAGAKARLTANIKSGALSERKTKSLCDCLAQVSSTLAEILTSTLPIGPCLDSSAKLATRFYLVMSDFVKLELLVCGAPNASLNTQFIKLVVSINGLTRNVYDYMNYANKGAAKRTTGSRGLNTQVIKAEKRGKLMPMLIFNLETYEKSLMRLEKKTGVKALTSSMKRNTNRDFRVDNSILRDALAHQSESEEEGEEQTVEADVSDPPMEDPSDSTQPPPTKRRRLGRASAPTSSP